MRIFDFLKYKDKQYDIVVYDHQGTLKVGTITRIITEYSENLYELDTNVVILENNILKKIGNLRKIRKELYGE